jgi:Flp pilus assembly protein TadG
MAAATRLRAATSVTTMFATFYIRHICNAARRFLGANNGNIGVIFIFAAIPVIGFVGAAIDYSRTNSARSSVQSALDSTALMLSKDLSSGTITADQVSGKAQLYFNALYTNPDGKLVPPSTPPNAPAISSIYTPNNGNLGNTIQLTVTAQVTTDFMKVLSSSLSTVNFTVSSTTAWGNVKMRVALALDNTGSMADDGKITALRTAVAGNGGLIDQLSALVKNDGDVYISVVPFAKDVNIGASNYNQTWIDWTDWNAANGTCSRSSYTTQSTCVNAGKTWTPANHNKWTGCVTDRTQNYDTLNTAPVATITDTFFPAEEYYENGQYYCKPGNSPPLQQIAPLTYDWSSLKTIVNAMQPTGGTNQPIGLAWAWQSLSLTGPLTVPPEDPNYTYNRVIIILSDGLNTEDRWPSYGNGSTQFGGQIDARQQVLCTNLRNAKDANGRYMYTVYTIQVDTSSPPDPTSTILQSCASSNGQPDPSKFFKLTSSGQIATTFTTIGTALSQLRVAQ